MHSLPDNALNPLGLLAEASLANRRAQAGIKSSVAAEVGDKIGVASDTYFKPGKAPSPSTPLTRRLTYAFLARPNDNTAVTETVHRAANTARDVELCQH